GLTELHGLESTAFASSNDVARSPSSSPRLSSLDPARRREMSKAAQNVKAPVENKETREIVAASFLPAYEDPAFWDARYTDDAAAGRSFDWLQCYEHLAPYLRPFLPELPTPKPLSKPSPKRSSKQLPSQRPETLDEAIAAANSTAANVIAQAEGTERTEAQAAEGTAAAEPAAETAAAEMAAALKAATAAKAAAAKEVAAAEAAAAAAAVNEFEIFIPGCGNSTLGADLVAAGYGNVTCADISPVVVADMMERYAHQAGLEYVVMDAMAMVFLPDGCFDLILDKALLDCI
ncbi:unnamed protein product, partial [Phaeothamnion confervicola]